MDFSLNIDDIPEMTYADIFGIDSGVYFIYTRDYEQLLYVGQSKRRLRRRVMQHIAKLEQLGLYLGDTTYSYARYKAIAVPQEKLNEVETHYISTLQPPLNIDKNPRKDKKHFDLWFMEKINEYDANNGFGRPKKSPPHRLTPPTKTGGLNEQRFHGNIQDTSIP